MWRTGNGYAGRLTVLFFVMVAMDENDKPMKVPPLIVETISQQAEWEAALLRKKNRQERRKEGY